MKYNTEEQLAFLGLRQHPFPGPSDDTDVYITGQTDKMIERLESAILTRKGFLLLTGETGLGKTTITQRIVFLLGEKNIATSLVRLSRYQENDFLTAINRSFGIVDHDLTIAHQMELLTAFLLEQSQKGINCAIVIDDAHLLSVESLGLIEMISDIEENRWKPVQIFLAGQIELKEKMARHELRKLKNRVAVWEEPIGLERSQLDSYLRFKLNKAGSKGKLSIEKQAVRKLFSLSKGNYRRINIIMDQALNQAFMERTLTVRKKFIEDVFFEDTESNSARQRRFLSVFAIIILLTITGSAAGGYFFYHHRIKPLKSIIPHPLPAVVVAKKMPPPVERNPVSIPPEPMAAIVSNQNDPVITFLKVYNLSAFEAEFSNALDNDTLPIVSKTIFSDTGLELLQFKSIPTTLQNRYHILAIESDQPAEILYYLFWKPVLSIPTYFPGYRGTEIKTLQALLKNLNLYDHNIDGIVGSKCTNGIIAFQTQNNLQATGLPDSPTLFLLTGLSGLEK